MDIDYANVFALTVYGKIGIKVWICKGEVLAKEGPEPQLRGWKGRQGLQSDRRDRRDGDHGHGHHRGDDRRGDVATVAVSAEAVAVVEIAGPVVAVEIAGHCRWR